MMASPMMKATTGLAWCTDGLGVGVDVGVGDCVKVAMVRKGS